MCQVKLKLVLFFLSTTLIFPSLNSQESIYNPSNEIITSFEKTAEKLIELMTIEEKASQMLSTSKALPNYGIEMYNWWNEALHGVARSSKATVFPQAIAMAATFDPELIQQTADAISTEARAMHNIFKAKGMRTEYTGLTFWSPNINIFRDPRWGRGHETYGEDPFLTGKIGTAFVSGDISITGPGETLLFEANVSSEKGTVFNIPLNDSKDFNENISYIKFTNENSNKASNSTIFKNLNGIELDFDLDINDNAEIEILIDQSSGSTINGYGNGNLIMNINNKGKFNMYGDFNVDSGKYNFVYAGILKKEFELKKGGTLSWTGDPKKALINLNTSYTNIQANPSILLDSPVNLSIPVNVNVNLFGELLNPSPEFELEFPNVDSSINNELQYRLNDKESIQLQAISLLATGSFQNDINFNEKALFGNLAESAASIINNILFDENDKLKFGLNYQLGENNPEFETNDELGVTMTTKLSDDILINGKLGVPIGGVTESVVAGDFEIELKLNQDRTLTMKIFNRENTIRYLGEQIGYTQGIGLSYKVEFNSFKKLVNKLLTNPN